MSLYTSAVSEILDRLWEGYDGFADYFHERNVNLRDLGHLLEEVFVPAYLYVKKSLDQNAVVSLHQEIADHILGGLMSKPGFRDLWEEWDAHTRQTFLGKPIEEQLGRILFEHYADQFARTFVSAFEAYHP